MADLVMIATMVGFVLSCIGYVHWCDRFIAADQVRLDRGRHADGLFARIALHHFEVHGVEEDIEHFADLFFVVDFAVERI